MAFIKYAAITNDDFSVGFVSYFDAGSGSFAEFKANYEAVQTNQLIVNIDGSAFPEGQGWEQLTADVVQFHPVDGIFQIVPAVKEKLCAQIAGRTPSLEYVGTAKFKGESFARDHSTRDDVVLLANTVATSPALAAELLPLRVNSIDFAEVTVDTVADAQAFALAMLSPTKTVYAEQADQIAAVQAMTTITQLIQYVDPR